MKNQINNLKKELSFLLAMALILVFASASSVYSQMVTPNLRINDADVDNIAAISKSLVVAGDNVYVVWSDDRSDVGNIYFSKSTDGGETFSPDIILSGSNSNNFNTWPSIAADESGGVYVTWTGFTEPYMGGDSGVNVWFVKSTDYGDSFDTPIQITTNDESVFSNIGLYDNYVHIFYVSVINGDKKGMPLANHLLASSSDGGNNFQSPVQVNDEAPIESVSGNNNTSIDTDPLTGDIYMVWIDGRREGGNDDIFFAKSTDNGTSISNNVRVNGLGTDWADYDKPNPTVSVGENNMVYVAYPVVSNGFSRLILAESTDGGENFTSEGFLADNDNDCNENSYDIMALPDGTIGALMITNLYDMGWNVWFAQPDETPLVFNDVGADFREPSLFLTNGGHTHAAWIDDREGKRNLYYARTYNLFAGGSGTSTEPWQIETIEHLNNVRYFTGHDHSDKYFIQLNDIDIENGGFKDGEGWEPIGNQSEPFTGNYNGDYNTIENLTINRPSEYFVGLFGFTDGATIENLGVINADVTGDRIVGALVGEANGNSIISECYSTGTVTGSDVDIGGLVGVNLNSNIYKSYSTANVSGNDAVGGLVGVNEVNGLIENSYSTGNVSGNTAIGGLAGAIFDNGIINNSYSTGYVSGNNHVGGLLGLAMDSGPITESYWDIDNSGQEESQGGEGKSTSEMISSATFDIWDFTNIWSIEEEESYPYLQWQGLAEGHNYPSGYMLTLEVYPDETAGTAENLSGEGPFIGGNMVDLLAEAEDGFEFLNWRKDGSQISANESFQYQMPAENVTLVAHFVDEGTDVYEVSIAIEPDGVGYTTGQGSYEEGEVVTVQAFSENQNYVFENWTDNNTLDETDNPYSFNMPDDIVNITANFRPAVNATIDPDSWSFPGFDDLEPIQTTVTWNDATEVISVYYMVGEEKNYWPFSVTPIDDETAILLIGDDGSKKVSKTKEGSYVLNCYVEFDVGNPALFTLTFTDPEWDVDIWVYDDDSNDGIPYASIYVVEEDITFETNEWGSVWFNLKEGNYTLNITKFGYLPVEDYSITVEAEFDGNIFDIPMQKDSNVFVEVIDSEPYSGETDVSVNTDIEITFEQDIQEGVINFGFGDITFEDEYFNSLGFDNISITEGNILYIELHHPLEYETEYTLTIPDYAVADAEDIDIIMEDNFVLSFTTEEEESFSIDILDGNVDFVYHEGDYFDAEFFIPELPSELEGETLSADQYVVFDELFEQEIIIPDVTVTPINDRRFRVYGTVGEVINTGAIGFDFYIETPEEDPIIVHSTSDFVHDDESYYGIAFVGIHIPEGDIVENPPLSEFDNLYNTEKSISFVKAGEGMITYEPGLDIMSSFAYLPNFQSYLNINSDEDYYAEIYTDALTFLHDKTALVTLYNVDYDYFTIYSTGFVIPASYASNIDPVANATAEKSNGTLTFGVDGFSRYTVLENLYELTLEVDPIDGGTAENLTGDGPFPAGTQVNLNATAGTDYIFANWEKDGANIHGNESFLYTMPAEDATLIAKFVDETTELYSVTINVEPEGAGYTTGQGSYEEGQNVSVEAFSEEGYIFVNWTDGNALNTTDNPHSFIMPDDNVSLTANFRDFVHASIAPDYFEYNDFDEVDEMVTTITWNDASDVERVYVLIGEYEENLVFNVEDIDGETATLTMSLTAKSSNFFKDGSISIPGFIEYDAGEDSEFTIEITNPTWHTNIKVVDSETGSGIKNAEIYIQETSETFYTDNSGYASFSIASGDYNIDVSAFGYNTESDYLITIEENLFDGNYFEIELDKDPNVFVEVIETDPEHEQTNVPITTNINITFERDIQEGVINFGFGDITFEDEYSNSLGFDNISITEGNILYIELNHPLEYETEYTLTIPDYAVADAEDIDIIMEEDLILTFTTKINPFNDATLSDLRVDGTTVEDFEPETLNYVVELPYGTTDIPVVEATANSSEAEVATEPATELPGITTIIVTAEDESTQLTYTVKFTVATEITEAISYLKVFPNPASNKVIIDCRYIEMKKIKMVDITGQIVYAADINSSYHEINVSDLKDSIYFIQIITNKSVFTKQLIVVN